MSIFQGSLQGNISDSDTALTYCIFHRSMSHSIRAKELPDSSPPADTALISIAIANLIRKP